MPYLLQKEKEDTIRAAIRTWTFNAEGMARGESRCRRVVSRVHHRLQYRCCSGYTATMVIHRLLSRPTVAVSADIMPLVLLWRLQYRCCCGCYAHWLPWMVTETTPQQRLAATLYIEFINLLLQLVGLMLIGSAVLVPLNWQYGDQSGDFFERCALTDKPSATVQTAFRQTCQSVVHLRSCAAVC